ncbi:MAG: ABC transporter ATP-binding protein [Firmicutes bacterium]|nr:ABC transporter ATP-binding protein [Bacillota bacterium]MDH7496532.1 ABC transporter ATP-binding protein [Bacillota bacterium]
MTMLTVEGLTIRYGDMEVVHGVSFEVGQRDSVAIIGANGSGKTTLLRTLMGLHRDFDGRITFMGRDIGRISPWARACLGMAMVPEGRRVFPDLSVEQNLLIGAYSRQDRSAVRASLDEVYSLFPVLRERRNQVGKTLSGGEQQMLAIGRALMAKPRLLMVDEVSTGLMPIFVDKAFHVLKSLVDQGVSVLLVEQNARKALAAMARGYVLETGRIVLSGPAAELAANANVRKAYLGA